MGDKVGQICGGVAHEAYALTPHLGHHAGHVQPMQWGRVQVAAQHGEGSIVEEGQHPRHPLIKFVVPQGL